ncbi:MAG TPA: AAA family ATPase [Candidatus Angelobacter sp.]|nr:AAA family ATPase [Candidatus Angelobacter sp.]
MERPTVLFATIGESSSHVAALERAGFTAHGADQLDEPHDLAVIDCDLPPEAVAGLYTVLRARGGTTILLLISAESELPDGVGGPGDEVALKPIAPDALVYRLQALLIRSGRSLPVESGEWATTDTLSSSTVAGEGHVVSVFAPKGGVGKTTVAVNIAVALRQQTRSEVLLFDADVGVGNVTSVLEVPYRMGLADLADSPPEEWTDAAFEQVVAIHGDSGVKVLTWGTDPAESERISVDLLLAALRWARNHHAHVIVDNHPGYDDRTMAMLAVANEIFLVVTPEVGAIRNSSQFLELARELGLGGVVRVIVNRANHGIKIPQIESSLGMPVSATVMSNGPKAVIASNEGHPIVTKYPREKIADDLHGVARLISAPEGVLHPSTPAATRRWWARLGIRTSQA